MASGTVVFQTAVTATPPNALAIMADSVLDTDHGAGTAQYIKLMDGATGGTLKAAVTANGLVVDTRGSILGTVQLHGTGQMLGTFQPLAGSVHLASGTVTVLGTIQAHGTTQALGTVQPLAGSVHPAAALPGTSHITGTVQTTGTVDVGTVRFIVGTVHVGTVQRIQGGTINSFGGTLGGGTIQTHGTSQVIGTVQAHGTNQALGTLQPLAGSVHVANVLSGTFQAHGTLPVGTVAGTVSILGTVQGLAGSVHLATNLAGGTVVAVGSAVHGAAADTRPLLIAAFGSSGTQVAVDDGDSVRLWADQNGRLQIRGTIDSMPAINVATGTIPGGTIQLHGTSEILGTVRALTTVTVEIGTIAEGTINAFTGTAQVLGTIQALLLAGSVQGWQANGGAAAGNPVLFGGFGSSGTQAAVDDGDVVRAWFDLNGRLQVRGTIDSLPAITGTVQSHGTVDVGTVRFVVGTVNIGTMQAGSVHVANTAAVLGTMSFVTGGTAHIGSVQRLTGGTLDFLGGTVAVGTVRQVLGTVLVKPNQAGEGFFGTVFTGAAAANGTVVPNPGQGTFVRVWDLVVSGSAAGSAFLELGDGTVFGHVFTAANGGFSFNSSKGVRTNGTNQAVLFTYTAGSWGVTCNYTLETL